MSRDLRATDCPDCGPVMCERLSAQMARCIATRWERVEVRRDEWEWRLVRFKPACGQVLATCGGCGSMTLAVGPDGMRCRLCGFERELRAEEREAIAAGPRVAPAPAPAAPAAPPPKPAQAFEPPPMPRFRPGAQMPAPAKPRGYVAPRAKGAR